VGLIHPTATVTPSPAIITCTLGPAIGTERTSEIQARVGLRVALSHPMVTAISRSVLVIYTAILVISTSGTSVFRAVAGDLDHAVTATTPHAPFTPTSVPAISTENY